MAPTLPRCENRWKSRQFTGHNAARGAVIPRSPTLAPTISVKPCNLGCVSTSSQSKDPQNLPKGYTPPKGRPTPKRVDQEIARGVRRDPAGVSAAQRHQNRKELKKSMSKQEWKEFKAKEREDRRAHNEFVQERMAAGDERYLLDRDKGEVRRYVRDWVDSRRFINEWVMPLALVLLVLLWVGTFSPALSNIVSIASMVAIVVFAVEGFWLARKANSAARERFPKSTEPGFGLGFYAYARASQPRKWRVPRPAVERGSKIS